MNDQNIRLLISYDGTDFSGWQRQSKNRSVQGEIEAALEKIHKHPVNITGSGRTDTGVHAAAQTANFYTDIKNIAPERFVMALNSYLPRDVRILKAEAASQDFHSRFDAKMRTYRYFIVCGRHALAHELRYALQLWHQPDVRLLNEYARLLHGEMDCSTFASVQDQSKSRNRFIHQANFFYQGENLIFEISANAFLWKMVRSIVGSLLFYDEKKTTPEEVKRMIDAKDRSLAGPTAPPQGLFLWNVEYYRN
ncbi:MAG: tRNA pseudouridine(38-40) synthase TruA [Treponema sp.]|jgi:tRNA pseudouridine38-40 synthase|nr:tRNA pseudouridine(38-40) synthase TruA [Treponema sp.]